MCCSQHKVKSLVLRIITTVACTLALLQFGCEQQSRNVSGDDRTIARVKAVVAKSLKTSTEKLDTQRPLASQVIKIDELDLVELVMAVEEEFKVEIPDASIGDKPAEIVKTVSIEKLAQIVSEQMRKKK